MHLGNDVGEVFTYYTRGQLTKTDRSLDMAIADSDLAFLLLLFHWIMVILYKGIQEMVLLY